MEGLQRHSGKAQAREAPRIPELLATSSSGNPVPLSLLPQGCPTVPWARRKAFSPSSVLWGN